MHGNGYSTFSSEIVMGLYSGCEQVQVVSVIWHKMTSGFIVHLASHQHILKTFLQYCAFEVLLVELVVQFQYPKDTWSHRDMIKQLRKLQIF